MKNAFSLVELSIVLVILGLLVGGILAGQSLIRASELRAISTEYARYITASQSFRDKYFGLPGDLSNATSFWGAVAVSCTSAQGTGTQTCNGTGNGQVGEVSYEMFRFWQHLANAGLVEGNYTGVAGPGGSADSLIGTNVPVSKLSSAGWTPLWLGNYSTTPSSWAVGEYNSLLIVGSDDATGYTLRPALTPQEAWNIDTKMDDGMPGTGSTVPYPYVGCSTISSANNNTDLTAPYALSVTTKLCSLAFRKSLY